MGNLLTTRTNNTNNPNNGQNSRGTGTTSAYYKNRLLREWKFLTEDPNVKSYFRCTTPERDVIFEVSKFCIHGYLLPGKEPYRNGEFEVRITLPAEFPQKPPIIELLTFIYHPCVHANLSKPEFCCDCCFFGWKPTFGFHEVIKYYVDIIDEPDSFYTNCDDTSEARMLYSKDKDEFNRKARIMVDRYASPRIV